MSSLLVKTEGIFNPLRKFAFTNITDEPFESAWNGQPIVIGPHETVKLDHYLANKFVDELVDKIMIGEFKNKEDQEKIRFNNPYYRTPNGMNLGVPAVRKLYEDKIVTEMPEEAQTAQAMIDRMKIREELLSNLTAKPSTEPQIGPTGVEEFADLPKGGFIPPTPVKEAIELPKVKGGPKKVVA
jgi:hypothetical protein